MVFADDSRGDSGGHLQRRGQAEAPLDVVANHGELGGGAAAERRDSAGVHGASAGDYEAAFFEDDLQSALDVFAGRAASGGAGVADDCDVVGAFCGEDKANHFDGKMETVGND